MGLSRALMKAGYGTRRGADDLVTSGRVRVGRKVVRDTLHMITAEDELFIDDKPLMKLKPSYYVFHKPIRVVCREQDGPGRRLASEFFPAGVMGLRTAGRLDGRTTGLLLVSNDSSWITRVTNGAENEHEFQVQVEGEVTEIQLTIIHAGIMLPGIGTFRPVAVRITERGAGRTHLDVVMHGGQARQMRRMFVTLRHKVVQVKRVRLGNVRLGSLVPGGIRPLTEAEIASF